MFDQIRSVCASNGQRPSGAGLVFSAGFSSGVSSILTVSGGVHASHHIPVRYAVGRVLL